MAALDLRGGRGREGERGRRDREPAFRRAAQFGGQHPADGEDGVDRLVERDGIRVAAEDEVGADEGRGRGRGVAGVAGDLDHALDEIADRAHRVLEGDGRRVAGLAGRAAGRVDDGRGGHGPGGADLDLAAGDLGGERRPPRDDDADGPRGEQGQGGLVRGRGPCSSTRVISAPGMTPADPPVGAAQTTPMAPSTCITAIARAAARRCGPPPGRPPTAPAV